MKERLIDISRGNLCEENKELILKFKRNCVANDLSVGRTSKLIQQLVIILELNSKPFTEWKGRILN